MPLLLLFLAFALRLYQLDDSGFWQDEGLTPLRAGYSTSQILGNQIIIQEGVTQDTHPPFYFLLIHFSRQLLGDSDFSFRYPSVLAGLLLIPLLYQFGYHIGGRRLGWLAALLAAVNPLQIWYAQEARMYTLVVLLGAIASYILWRALEEERAGQEARRLLRWFVLYLPFAALAFLTHYTALFLVAAHVPFWLWLLWRRGLQRLILLGAALAILLFIPFIPYTIPRLFTGAEANYFYVSPLIMLQDVVHGFGMGMTGDLTLWRTRLLDLFLALLLLVGILYPARREEGGEGAAPIRLFLLVYLLATVVGLALGSLLKPMYQGARHIIIGSPAFFLLLARGIEALPRRPRWLPAAALGLALIAPLLSLSNLYFDPLYDKDDIRTLVHTVEERAGAEDLVLYNNAILLPLHRHYQRRPDLTVMALPIYPHAADASTEAQLAQLAGEYERIWFFVDPPADRRDSQGLVQMWLDSHLLAMERHRAHARTILVEVVGYDTRPWRLETLPEGALQAEATWEGLPELRGWRLEEEIPQGGATLWLDLFWRQGVLPPAEQQLRFQLRDESGDPWLDDNRSFWPRGNVSQLEASLLRLPYGLPLRPGMPPGRYELRLLPWIGDTGSAGEAWVSLGTVDLDPPASTAALALDTRYPLQFQNGLQLLGIASDAVEVRPGHAVPLRLYWQAAEPLPGLRYEVEVVGPDDRVWTAHSSSPGPDWLQVEQWPRSRPVQENVGFLFPPEAPPGRYRLRWRLLQEGEPIPVRPAWRPWYGEGATYGEITVRAWPLETEIPASQYPLDASFGPAIRLTGYDLEPLQPAPGDTLALTLYWQAEEVPAANYRVFVHVLDNDDTILFQQDQVPVNWLRPTSGWRAGEVFTDPYLLQVPLDLSPGSYKLYVGLYDPDTGVRLPVSEGGQPVGDRLLLQVITVE